ncbi:hypothetical protein X636_23925 [Pandoraea pnomenusa]|nr:hypothetical protein X636_23925 [Pandoraea pnomenusa]
MAKRLRASPLRNFAHERFQTHEWASSGHGVAGTIADIFSSAKWRRAARAKGFACVRLSIDDMPNSWFSSQSASSTPLHIYANHAPSTPNVACHGGLADDFAHARQTAVGTSACRPGPAAPTRVRARHDERQLVARRPAPLQVSNEATATPPIRRVVDDSVSRTEQIYTALRDDVALPALRRFERLHRFRASPGNGDTGRASEDRPNPVWFDNLQPHLRVEAQILSQRGLDAAKFRQRLGELIRHEHPGLSWRATRAGLERDALPFALGSTLLSMLADLVDPGRSRSVLWPPVEAAGVVLVNLLGMARFNAVHPTFASRLGRATPAQAQEALARMLRCPVREVLGHVAAFVLCYGLLRNLGRVVAEAGLTACVPGLMSHRFGNTIHSALEILLAPIPGALLGPAIDRLSMPREYAALEIAIQDRFADLICRTGTDTGAGGSWPSVWHQFSGLVRSTAPKAIWATLTLGFYFLSTLHDGAAQAQDGEAMAEPGAPLSANATSAPAAAGQQGTDVDWHGLSVLGVLYGLIGGIVALQGMAARNDDMATAYTRRRGRPKVSTATVTSQADSGRASTSSYAGTPDSPLGRPALPSDASDSLTDPGDTSGDDSVFLPMPGTDIGDVIPRLPLASASQRALRAPPVSKPQTRRHGTCVAPDQRSSSPSSASSASSADEAPRTTPL